MTAFVDIQTPDRPGAEFIAVASSDGSVLEMASGPTATIAADQLRDIFLEAELTDNAAELIFAEMQEIHR